MTNGYGKWIITPSYKSHLSSAEDFTGYYSIDEYGTVYTHLMADDVTPPRILQPSITPQGLRVGLYKDRVALKYWVHILWAWAFLEGYRGQHISFLNGDRTDIREDNINYLGKFRREDLFEIEGYPLYRMDSRGNIWANDREKLAVNRSLKGSPRVSLMTTDGDNVMEYVSKLRKSLII